MGHGTSSRAPEGTPPDKVVEKPIWDSIKVPMGLLTCPGPQDGIFENKELCHLKCALGRCPNCPKVLPDFPTESITWDSPEATDKDFIVWKYYDGRYFCIQHGHIGKESKCHPCVDHPEEKPDRGPQRKIHYCRNRAPIGNFLKEDLLPLIDRYRHHLFLMIILGRDWCVKFRLENYHKVKGSVLVVRDYTDRVDWEMNGMAQSHGMSNRDDYGLEGITARFVENDGETDVHKYEFFSYVSGAKTQNAKTSYMNTCLMITHLQLRGQLPRLSGATLYQQSDNCAAQYTSGTAIWCAIMIANRFGITVNIMFTCPQHGKGTVDALSGADKAFLKRHFLMAGHELGVLDNATMDEDDFVIDGAKLIADLLGAPNRKAGLEGDKHKHKEGATVINDRHYTPIDWETMNMPIPKTTFVVDKGLPKVKVKDPVTGVETTRPHDGSKDMYQVYCDWRIPELNQCAMRRMPCSCELCHTQLNLPWDHDLEWTEQPRFEKTCDCVLDPVLEGENGWKFVTLKPTKKSTEEEREEELEEVFIEVLHQYEVEAAEQIVCGGFGAIDTTDKEAKEGYYVVQWTGEPYMLPAPAQVEGCESGEMPAGTYVCEGRYLDRINRSPHWYYNSNATPVLFRLQFVIAPKIKMTAYNPEKELKPNGFNSLSRQAKSSAATTVMMVSLEDQKRIVEEKKIREKLDHFELNFVDNGEDYEEDEDGEEQVESDEEEEEEEE